MKILVVDDHHIVRKGIIILLKKDFKDIEFLEASNGIAALKTLKENTIDLVLSDIAMPKLNGIEFIKQAKELGFKMPFIFLSMQIEDHYAIRALKAGAYGYLNKSVSREELVKAVNKVLSGKKYISSNIADLLLSDLSKVDNEDPLKTLSDREMQVFQLIAEGKKVSEIAIDIALSVNTISTYRSRILEKLNFKNNSEIIRYAIENSIN